MIKKRRGEGGGEVRGVVEVQPLEGLGLTKLWRDRSRETVHHQNPVNGKW